MPLLTSAVFIRDSSQEDVKPETEPNCEAVEAKKQDNESQPPKKTLEARLTETPEEKPAPKLLLSRCGVHRFPHAQFIKSLDS